MAFLGGFLAVLLVAWLVYYIVRAKIKSFFQQNFGSTDIMSTIEAGDLLAQETPRSLSGADRLLLPQIMRDFPDFNPELAKTYAREALQKKLAGKPELTIYKVVISRYLPSSAEKTIIFQAALSYKEEGRVQQKRYDLHYTYLLSSGNAVAANCPNCGGALGYGDTVCPYCGCRVANALGNAWEFTDIRES